MRKSKKSIGSIVFGLIVAAVVWFLQEKGLLEKDSGSRGGGGSASSYGGETSGEGWTHLKKCRFISGRNSDGDSFHVKHEKGETEFRLYFVDTPESTYKTYGRGENNGARIAEQGDYFGGLSQKQTTGVGKDGKDFVKKLLSKNNFEVETQWEDVYGPERKYCFVLVPWEGKKVYLHELMVKRGLARIHTRGADLPEGRGYHEQKSYLKSLEKTARKEKVGAWGL